jgi:hypothetical protein
MPISLLTYRIDPYLPYGNSVSEFKQTRSDWLRTTINALYNQNKGRLKSEGIQTDLFHDHDENTGKQIVRYPLIIYHVIGNEFYITGINVGKNAVEELIRPYDRPVEVNKDLMIRFDLFREEEIEIKNTRSKQKYILTDWLPFSSGSFKLYAEKPTLIEKIKFLEERLQIHIVKDLGKFLGFDLSKTRVSILEVDDFKRPRIHLRVNRFRHDFQPFTILFEANVIFPDFITLGNGKAFGYGRINKISP